jgi:hypothetical protein
LGNLATPENIQKLQTALHAKAKGEPGFRFYSLYDKVYLREVLEYAYACCRANQGAAGVDGERFEDIETYGVERWLGELADTLRKKTYRPQALRRVYVPKPNGKLRPLSIPTIRDRTAMTAATLRVLSIFEVLLSTLFEVQFRFPFPHAVGEGGKRKWEPSVRRQRRVEGWCAEHRKIRVGQRAGSPRDHVRSDPRRSGR